jgi:long-chain acyl-CoA synthetase
MSATTTTSKPLPIAATLADLLPLLARHHPDRTALVMEDRSLTYAELDQAAGRLAGALAARGVMPGDRITLHGPNSWQWVVAYYAVLRSGAILNPLNLMLTPPEVAHAVRDCGAGIVITTAASVPGLSGLREAGVRLIAWGGEAREPGEEHEAEALEPLTAAGAMLEPHACDPGAPAMICYTSGTTGLPKGAVLTHRGILHNAAAIATMFVMDRNDVMVSAMPLPHVGGHVMMNAAFQRGMRLAQFGRFDPVRVQDAVERLGGTIFFGAPAMFLMVTAAPGFAAEAWRSLRVAAIGGAGMPPEQMRAVERALGHRLLELWGMTELSGVGAAFGPLTPNKHGSIGVAVPFVQLRIGALDDDAVTVPPDEPGELLARGPSVMQGYWNNAAATAETLTGDGWLRTGDIARMDADGCIFVVDRRKDMILSSGYNVYPAELERVLCEHPAVATAAVGRQPDPVKGEIAKAYVVLKREGEATIEELEAFCRHSLAAYKVPRAFQFVSDLPRTPSGKVLRRELCKLDGGDPARSAAP